MGANRKFETLADITRDERANVSAKCRCGYRGTIDGRKLTRWAFVHRWDTRISAIGKYLRCTRCGTNWPQVGMSYDTPTCADWGPRNEDGWKRLVRRLRG